MRRTVATTGYGSYCTVPYGTNRERCSSYSRTRGDGTVSVGILPLFYGCNEHAVHPTPLACYTASPAVCACKTGRAEEVSHTSSLIIPPSHPGEDAAVRRLRAFCALKGSAATRPSRLAGKRVCDFRREVARDRPSTQRAAFACHLRTNCCTEDQADSRRHTRHGQCMQYGTEVSSERVRVC